MTIRPIIFSAPMVRALLEGRKTQTRRIAKRQDIFLRNGRPFVPTGAHSEAEFTKPGYAVGDLLYVREAGYFAPNRVAYAATNEALTVGERVEGFGRLRPSIHMPRWASRLTLAVTGVKVEMLQDISENDAMAEGVASTDFWAVGVSNMDSTCQAGRIAFRHIWKSLHGPDAWDLNPWVVALTFDVLKINVDQFVKRQAA